MAYSWYVINSYHCWDFICLNTNYQSYNPNIVNLWSNPECVFVPNWNCVSNWWWNWWWIVPSLLSVSITWSSFTGENYDYMVRWVERLYVDMLFITLLVLFLTIGFYKVLKKNFF